MPDCQGDHRRTGRPERMIELLATTGLGTTVPLIVLVVLVLWLSVKVTKR